MEIFAYHFRRRLLNSPQPQNKVKEFLYETLIQAFRDTLSVIGPVLLFLLLFGPSNLEDTEPVRSGFADLGKTVYRFIWVNYSVFGHSKSLPKECNHLLKSSLTIETRMQSLKELRHHSLHCPVLRCVHSDSSPLIPAVREK
ncbi:hypothetical protein VNO78_03069 [Psophocarpus tetragonolobus]|uniref:Uncharacterized protein n=1 Tax=Psophocarpus tetragonolobus TaxID=3891 RepID=A0AAN9T0H9_PSOTE